MDEERKYLPPEEVLEHFGIKPGEAKEYSVFRNRENVLKHLMPFLPDVADIKSKVRATVYYDPECDAILVLTDQDGSLPPSGNWTED